MSQYQKQVVWSICVSWWIFRVFFEDNWTHKGDKFSQGFLGQLKNISRNFRGFTQIYTNLNRIFNSQNTYQSGVADVIAQSGINKYPKSSRRPRNVPKSPKKSEIGWGALSEIITGIRGHEQGQEAFRTVKAPCGTLHQKGKHGCVTGKHTLGSAVQTATTCLTGKHTVGSADRAWMTAPTGGATIPKRQKHDMWRTGRARSAPYPKWDNHIGDRYTFIRSWNGKNVARLPKARQTQDMGRITKNETHP
jgi:hypothetical protein